MCDEITEADLDRAGLPVRRRAFGALVGAGAVASMLPAAACAAGAVKGRDVGITTDDGTVDAYFVAPSEGTHPGVLMWPDIRGLRPAFRQMADRLAGDGYAVLCVNPFYRWAKAPVVYSGHDFDDPGVRDTLFGYLQKLDKSAVQTDAKAHLAFLDAQKEVDTARKTGTVGYCMGGPMVIWTAALAPDRIAAAASFHGARVATDAADSPHLLIPGTKAGYLFAIADNDDQQDPESKERLKAVLDPRPEWHEVEVYKGALHGWCPPDGRAYNEEAAEKGWSRMLALFKTTL
ncbi:dienelactone hydrolase family protein [Sphingopyxis indica]|uniref:Carboxymethylenebutenolidase n=1 Tax=Sphingopyxis indica TaxID=436663 RepID=A0A239E896_9SPHN|nr:dienelactone hydrolase family protein [Sphingopyxis indica]SNS40866.1 carboxymethylenebutenolidase [Sphingopyxis indica]